MWVRWADYLRLTDWYFRNIPHFSLYKLGTPRRPFFLFFFSPPLIILAWHCILFTALLWVVRPLRTVALNFIVWGYEEKGQWREVGVVGKSPLCYPDFMSAWTHTPKGNILCHDFRGLRKVPLLQNSVVLHCTLNSASTCWPVPIPQECRDCTSALQSGTPEFIASAPTSTAKADLLISAVWLSSVKWKWWHQYYRSFVRIEWFYLYGI